MEKILSICIPVYNGGDRAYRYIKEILAYEKDDIEVVVSDNASTDNTVELIRGIDDNRLKLITHKKNAGSFVNWYRALMAGTAKYVMLHQDNDRIMVKNLPRYLEFLKSIEYDVVRNCRPLSESREITVAQVQYYNFFYSHASYVMYRREALHSIKPLKFSMDTKCTSYPYVVWDTQILKRYRSREKRAYLNGDIKITYNIDRDYYSRLSRTREFDKSSAPAYSYENVTQKFENYIKVLRYLYPVDCEYGKLLCNAYRANLYWATTHFYGVMKNPASKRVKERYGLTSLDTEEIDYVQLNDDFFRRICLKMRMHSPVCRFITMARLKLITLYNKNHFLVAVYAGKMDEKQRRVRKYLDTVLNICVEKVCT